MENIEKPTITILWLDDHNSFDLFESISPALGTIEYDLNLRVVPIFEDELVENYDKYQLPSSDLLTKIKKLTAKIGDDQIDIIVVGNNLGVGLKKAEAINCTKMDFTIITYSMEISEAQYRKMGFINFCSRDMLGDKLVEIARIFANSLT